MKNLARVSTPPNLLASSCSTIGLSKCRRKARVRLITSPMGCCEGRLVRKAGPLQLCPNQSPASRGERAVVLIKVERKIGSHFHHVAFLEQSARGGLSPATDIAYTNGRGPCRERRGQ